MSVNKCKSQTFPVEVHELINRKTQSENASPMLKVEQVKHGKGAQQTTGWRTLKIKIPIKSFINAMIFLNFLEWHKTP